MTTKKLTHWLLKRYKSTDSLPQEHRYAAWINGLVDPVVGPGDKKYAKGLYTELSKNQLPITAIMEAETPICKRIQHTKKFCSEQFPNLQSHRYHQEWWLRPWLYNEWGRILKVSDIFVKGIGSFDFCKVAAGITDLWHMRRREVQATGYFPGSHRYGAAAFFDHKPYLDYLVKYWAFLKDYEHVDAVTQNLRERRHLSMPFIDLHPTKLELDYGNVVFGWLADVSIPGFTIPKTGKELEDAAVRFQNCARNYVASVMRKHSIILWNDVGMAEYRREGLGQCMGVKNTEIDKEPFKAIEEQVKKLFK